MKLSRLSTFKPLTLCHFGKFLRIFIMFALRLCLCTLTVISIFTLFSSAQLTGQLTRPGNLFIITVDITNPTTDTISILKWNNVFDNSTNIPFPFTVTDDQGFKTAFATTYVMRSGMYNAFLPPSGWLALVGKKGS